MSASDKAIWEQKAGDDKKRYEQGKPLTPSIKFKLVLSF